MTDPNQDGDDPKGTIDTEGGEDLSNTTDTESKDQGGDKEKEGGEFRDTIVDSHMAKLTLGKTTLEEIESKHKWIADEIRARQSDNKPKEEPDVEAKLEERVLERLEVKTLQNEIMSAASKEQKEIFDEELARYKDSLGEKEATVVAMRIARIDTSEQARNRRNLSTPSFGSGSYEDKPRVTADDRRMAKMLGVTPEKVAQTRTEVEG